MSAKFGPPVKGTGPLNARILILGEAPGEQETERGLPFVGPSGAELRRMLRTIGVQLDDTYRTNVFSRRPPNNNVACFGVPRGDDSVCNTYTHLGPLASEPLTFLDAQWEPELQRLHAELASVRPNIIIALGNTACWALGLGLGINSLRGSVHSIEADGVAFKVLPTYHPAAVLRQWDLRVIAIADLEKARVESAYPELRYDRSTLWLNPTLDDLAEFDAQHMAHSRLCACDIETKRGQITCISFAPSLDHSLAIPFWLDGPEPNYWSEAEERLAWRYVIKWMEDPALVKVGQNFMYDLQYLQKICNPRACTEDTMLMHHSLYSELQKGLGFLGSTYANVPSWKSMRTFKKEEQLKRDD